MELDTFEEVYEAAPKSIADMEKMAIPAVLISIGGYVAMGLGATHFFVSILTETDFIFLFQFIVNLSFGYFLLICNLNIKRNPTRWLIYAGIFGLILMVLGGSVGAISGFIALIGGVLGLLGIDEL